MRSSVTLSFLFLLGCPGGPDATDKDDGPADTGEDPDDSDGDGVAAPDDCDDGDDSVFPGATETCNGVDDDCDGTADDDAADVSLWYADADGDGYGDGSSRKSGCTAPEGYVASSDDCNDASADFNPGAAETACDGPDYNCNGTFDEGDADGDGVLACDDCDDQDPTVLPGVEELCDGIDNDCNGAIDDGTGASESFFADVDGDGFGNPFSYTVACAAPEGHVADSSDCDDALATVYPGADEYCNGIDDDCDGRSDEAAVDVETWYLDADGDGYGWSTSTATGCEVPAGYTADSTDCNDASSGVYPGAPEYCGGVDHDCDGAVNEAGSVDIATYYGDADGDGYNGTAVGVGCTAPSDYTFTADDCDDGDPEISPDAEDVCDDTDNDCDGDIDDGLRVPTDYGSIQGAIDAATTGEHVCVAAGTYYEALEISTYGVTLQGAGAGSTIIDALNTGNALYVSNYYGTTTVADLTLTGGRADYGAGLRVGYSAPVLRNLEITDNSCTGTYCYGVGLYVDGDVTIQDVTVSNNSSYPVGTSSYPYVYAMGTGAYLYYGSGTIDGLVIEDNVTKLDGVYSSSYTGYSYGAGLHLAYYAGTFTNTVIEGNSVLKSSTALGYAYVQGAGIYTSQDSSSFDGLEINENTTTLAGTYDYASGGGVYAFQSDNIFSEVNIRANVLDAYQTQGGGFYFYYTGSPLVTNAVVAGNKMGSTSMTNAYVNGGGMYSYYYATPELVNVDFAGNKCAGYQVLGCGISVDYYGGLTANNVAVVGNTSSATYTYGGGVYGYTAYTSGISFTYSNIYGNTATEFYDMASPVGSNGNIAVAPGYTSTASASATGWNLELTATSGMRNVGDPAISDVDGTRSDIGAYGGPSGAW